jgi:hypothetical protein
MTRDAITSDQLPAPGLPFSAAARGGGLLSLSAAPVKKAQASRTSATVPSSLISRRCLSLAPWRPLPQHSKRHRHRITRLIAGQQLIPPQPNGHR